MPDDDDDLELEPIDPEITEHQRERTKRQSRVAEDAVDVNAGFDQEQLGDPFDLEQLKKFRFTTRHMLIATAVLAMIMTLFIRLKGCMGLFVSGCIALGAGWWFVLREEQRRLEKLAADREKLDQQIAAQRAVEDGEPTPTGKVRHFDKVSAGGDTAGGNTAAEAEDNRPPALRFSFSMQQLLVTFTVAAVILGCSQILGFENAAMLLGLVALLGLVTQAIGFELPPLVVLGWWLLMVMYLLVSVWTVFGIAAAA